MDWPKCEECEGRGTIIDQLCPAHDYGDPGYPPAECGFCERKPCPACNGTGERDLTADEAADVLRKQGETDNEIWKLEPDYMHDSNDYVVKRTETYLTGETIAGRPQKDFTWNTIGFGKTPTAALNAAARA